MLLLPPVAVSQFSPVLVVADPGLLLAEHCIPGIVEIAGPVAAGHTACRRTEDSPAVHRIAVAAGSFPVGEHRIGSGCSLHIAGIAVVRTEGTAEIGVGTTERPVGNEPLLAGRSALFEGFQGSNFAEPAGRGGRPGHLYRLWENCQNGIRRLNVLSGVKYLPTS